MRSRSLGKGLGLRWLCPRCFRRDPPVKLEVYHARHACGHGVFWENGVLASALSKETCPWCPGRGEDRRRQAMPHRSYADYGPPYGRVYPNMRELGPGDGGGNLPVFVHHHPSGSCCASREVTVRDTTA